jgi:beta-alanine degradation protein BauB
MKPENSETTENAHGRTPFVPGLESLSKPAEGMSWVETGAVGVDGVTKIEAADGYGEWNGSKHGSFFRFSGGFVSPVHSHTDDYAAVVVTGEMANYRPGEEPVKLDPGSMWYQKGHEAHTTVCYSEEGCLAFIIQDEKFDAQVPPVTD